MEAAWRNRLTGQSCQRPESAPFLGLWYTGSNTPWVGSDQDLEQPSPASEPGELLRQSLASLATRIRRLGDVRQWVRLVPLDPTITSELTPRDCETALIEALPQLEALSHNPRSHLTIEEVREEVGRARRVSHRAIAALAAHSEDWQSRTFLGVRPRRILAETRKDQWDIYENRAVATLRKRILGVLHPRLQWLNQILRALDEASEHSGSIRGTRFRRDRLYRIWGEMFGAHPSREVLAKLVADLDGARARLLALSDTHLFKQMGQFVTVGNPLHSTNVFQSDANYRRVFDLWHQWESHSVKKPPSAQERAQARRRSIEDWDLFVTLLTIRACRQLGLVPDDITAQPLGLGQSIGLKGAWSLEVHTDRTLLLRKSGVPQLEVVGLYCCLGAQAEKQIEAALLSLCEGRPGRPPLLVVTVHDPTGPSTPHSPELMAKLQILSSEALLSDRLAVAEVSPFRIDSTELIARAIRWVTAEQDWARIPICEEIKGSAAVWRGFSPSPGVGIEGDRVEFSRSPSDRLIAEAQSRSNEARRRLEDVLAEREQLKEQERRVRGDRGELAKINLRKKELTSMQAQEESHAFVCEKIHAILLRVGESFRELQACPCCGSKYVEQQGDALLMTCIECETQWGRRVCGSCRRDYAFMIPRDVEAVVSPEAFDAPRIFGADMCALILPPTTAPFVPNATACPHCTDRVMLGAECTETGL